MKYLFQQIPGVISKTYSSGIFSRIPFASFAPPLSSASFASFTSPLSANTSLKAFSSNSLIIPDKVAEEMYKNISTAPNKSNDPLSLVIPDLEKIEAFTKSLKELYKINPEFKKFSDELFKVSRQSKAFGINYNLPEEIDPHGRYLVATGLSQAIGFVPVCNKNMVPLIGSVTSGVGAVSGHQDMIRSSFVKLLLLINLGSNSDCVTWFKSNHDIIQELKESYPSSYQVLKTVKFLSNMQSEAQTLIDENNNIRFKHHFLYSPLSGDLYRFGILRDKALEALFNLDKVINSEPGRHPFIFKDSDPKGSGKNVQMLIINNKDGFHGRTASNKEKNTNEETMEVETRYLIAVALEGGKTSVTASSVPGR